MLTATGSSAPVEYYNVVRSNRYIPAFNTNKVLVGFTFSSLPPKMTILSYSVTMEWPQSDFSRLFSHFQVSEAIHDITHQYGTHMYAWYRSLKTVFLPKSNDHKSFIVLPSEIPPNKIILF
jgi:hypothetical protein